MRRTALAFFLDNEADNAHDMGDDLIGLLLVELARIVEQLPMAEVNLLWSCLSDMEQDYWIDEVAEEKYEE